MVNDWQREYKLREYRLPLLLGGVVILLLGGVILEWRILQNKETNLSSFFPMQQKTPPEVAAAEEEFELPALDEYEQMTERPLFMENRRPGSEIVAETAPPPLPPTPMNLKLMGVVVTPENKMALLTDAKGKYKRLRVQEHLEGWVLVELKTDRVTLQQGEKHEDLPLLKIRPKQNMPMGMVPPSIPPPPPPGPPTGRPGQRYPTPPQMPDPIEDESQNMPEEFPADDLSDQNNYEN